MFNWFGFKKEKREWRVKPTVLLVLDGFGDAPPSGGNAIALARKPTIDYLVKNYPYGKLIASGESVGLPAGEEGNSEVGHLTMGAGRVVYQSLLRINNAIADESFFENEAILAAIDHAQKYSSRIHLVGMVSSGHVHSSNEHLFALLEMMARNNFKRVKLHLFTDGRDAPPQEGAEIVAKVEAKIRGMKLGSVATVSGRYYALDRDGHWERTQKVYEAMVGGTGVQAVSASEAVRQSYAGGLTDEFVLPTVIALGNPMENRVLDNDAIIFFNFRVDRPRQLAMAFTVPNFEKLQGFDFATFSAYGNETIAKKSGPTFARLRKVQNLFSVTMTEYQKSIPVSGVAYPPFVVAGSLPEIISGAGLPQLHLAESEKERMVTYYVDGMNDRRFAGEEVVIVPSPKVATFDKKPEMAAYEILAKFKKAVNDDKYHLLVVNLANPDMVAHSGVIKAAVKAVEVVDEVTGEMVRLVTRAGGRMLITADHGNAEDLKTLPVENFFFTTEEGKINTQHSANPVPVFLVDPRFAGVGREVLQGKLSDVAPTILGMMGLAIPKEMTGRNLLLNF